MHFVIGNELKAPVNGKIDEIKKIIDESGIHYEIWFTRHNEGRFIWKTIYSNNGATITEEYDVDY